MYFLSILHIISPDYPISGARGRELRAPSRGKIASKCPSGRKNGGSSRSGRLSLRCDPFIHWLQDSPSLLPCCFIDQVTCVGSVRTTLFVGMMKPLIGVPPSGTSVFKSPWRETNSIRSYLLRYMLFFSIKVSDSICNNEQRIHWNEKNLVCIQFDARKVSLREGINFMISQEQERSARRERG